MKHRSTHIWLRHIDGAQCGGTPRPHNNATQRVRNSVLSKNLHTFLHELRKFSSKVRAVNINFGMYCIYIIKPYKPWSQALATSLGRKPWPQALAASLDPASFQL